MTERKITEMHRRFGRRGYGRCADCPHYTRYTNRDKTYRKCRVYGVTSSEATDWAGFWDACTLFDKDYDGPEIVGLWRKNLPQEAEEPLPGQMDLFEEVADAEK